MKRLTKSSTDKKICGVCAGIALYLDLDPTLVRVLWAILTLISAGVIGIIAYIVIACIVPYDNEVES
jgi:phage shock protein C